MQTFLAPPIFARARPLHRPLPAPWPSHFNGSDTAGPSVAAAIAPQTYLRSQQVAQDWAGQMAGADPAPPRPPGRGKLAHRARRADIGAWLATATGHPLPPADPAALRAARALLPPGAPQAYTPPSLWQRGARPTVAVIGDADMPSALAGGPSAAQNVIVAAIMACAYLAAVWLCEAFSSSVRGSLGAGVARTHHAVAHAGPCLARSRVRGCAARMCNGISAATGPGALRILGLCPLPRRNDPPRGDGTCLARPRVPHVRGHF